MASHHKRERSPYFWISYHDANGKQKWHNSKLTHDQEADAIAMCRSFERQVRRSPLPSGYTVAQWAARWFEERGKKMATMKDDKSRITKHVLPYIGAIELANVRKADVQAVFDRLRAIHDQGKMIDVGGKRTRRPGWVASGTIKSIYAAVKMMFSDAVAADLLQSSPLFLTSRTLPSVHKTARLPYTLAEIEQIIFAPADVIPDDRRTLYAILFFFGLRFGEGAAFKWSDFDETRKPLAGMNVEKAYSVRRKTIGKTKTETVRWAPVHPVCYFMLQQWRDVGFPALFGREPRPDDLIVPSREGRCRSSNHGMKKLRQDLQRLGLTDLDLRTQHAFRTTFISQMRVAEVEKDKVRAVTHGKRSSGDVIDAHYTVWPWDVLCKAVLQMPFSKEFLHSFETLVSDWNCSGKWRGGRDSKPAFERYLSLLSACVLAFSASSPLALPESFNEVFTPIGRAPTSISHSIETAWSSLDGTPLELSNQAEELLARLRALEEPEYPRHKVTCDECGKSAHVEEAPNMWECLFCLGPARVEV
jgi:integrase